jgi:hypothetical protein
MKKITAASTGIFVLFVLFVFSMSASAEAMREGDSLPPGYPRNQIPPPAPGAPLIPENPPEREPLSLPLQAPLEPITRRLPAASAISNTPVVFSRTAKAAVGQHIEIPFGGNGWVYLGETNGQKGVTYSSHRLDKDGQNFIFSAEKSGTYALKFYKQDYIRDYTLYDNVQIIVTPAPAATDGYAAANRGVVFADPRWPTAEQEAAIIEGAAVSAPVISPEAARTPSDPAASVQPDPVGGTGEASAATVQPVNAALGADAAPDQFIQKAQTEFDAKNMAGVLSILEQFREKYPNGADGDDEAWWLYAQACEAHGPDKDIRTARYCYQRIVNDYPFSSHRGDAQKRISYIDRYYINIQ